MANLPWEDAIKQVLGESDDAMHYTDIAEKIVEMKYKEVVGATPANSVAAYISTSMKKFGEQSPFQRVCRGEYILRDKPDVSLGYKAGGTTQEEDFEETEVIQAFGLYWQRELVHWTNKPDLLGKQQVGADVVNFKEQVGIYLLLDGRDVIYVGRAIKDPLGKRLSDHTKDRLRGRWDRFSWFGLYKVTDKGEVEVSSENLTISIATMIGTLESLLIENLEPPQNRKRGDEFNAIEYLQDGDPQIIKKRKMEVLVEMMETLERS